VKTQNRFQLRGRRLPLLVTLLAGTAGLIFAIQQQEPVVRIGLDQNASTVTVRSSAEFRVQEQPARSARFSVVLSVAETAPNTVLRRENLTYRMIVELDGGRLLALPMTSRVRIVLPDSDPAARLQVGDRTYRGAVEVFGNSRNTMTVVNELPLEEYLLGVVPNELSPTTFGELEAMKAQAVAARTYVVKNLGQYRQESFDICNTDACQVYFGAGTEDALSTQAVSETRGLVATYNGQPINALYSSTCGGRTENVGNIFEEKLPYLVSVACEFKHPEPLPFRTSRVIADYKEAVLAVAGVRNYTELRRFLGLPGAGEPPSTQPSQLARYLRENFYPNARPLSDADFMIEQGILSLSALSREDILFRLIDRKGAFEWQQGVLVSWSGETMKLAVAGQPVEFRLSPDAPIFFRIGEERTALREGSWIGGELFDFRAVDGVIQMAVYRRNFVNPSADRYSRLATWQVRKTRQEIETAFRGLNIGDIQGIRILERGPSERPVRTEVTGSRGKAELRALRLRSLLGLRDSLFHFDEERNAKGQLIGMTFYGSGWGHGVGMCQVGAYGMALDGATFQEILKKYYTGIELTRIY
jgi:peptidoglycan hydrolase-like amidase